MSYFIGILKVLNLMIKLLMAFKKVTYDLNGHRLTVNLFEALKLMLPLV